jgi:hypothetical protein
MNQMLFVQRLLVTIRKMLFQCLQLFSSFFLYKREGVKPIPSTAAALKNNDFNRNINEIEVKTLFEAVFVNLIEKQVLIESPHR